MLSFEEKLKVIESFPELERKNVSLGRVNFHYNDSVFEKKIVVQHLHPNGNGFVYAGNLQNYEVDAKGFINIRDFSEADLRRIVKESIQSLSANSPLGRENASLGKDKKNVGLMMRDKHCYLYSKMSGGMYIPA